MEEKRRRGEEEQRRRAFSPLLLHSSSHFLVVGLGNPGLEYSRTRHNIGWIILDELAQRNAILLDKKQSHAKVGGGLIGEQKVLLAKPQTFMNLSGKSVAGLMNFYRIEASRILVLCDDLNLPTGKIRLRSNGSDGGQNGLKSVAQMIGTREYARLRFGVGAPPEPERRERGSAAYVLRPFAADELSLVETAIARACDCIETFAREGVQTAMNRFNAVEADEKKPLEKTEKEKL